MYQLSFSAMPNDSKAIDVENIQIVLGGSDSKNDTANSTQNPVKQDSDSRFNLLLLIRIPINLDKPSRINTIEINRWSNMPSIS